MHCRKSLLFDNETAWTKKNHSNMFHVTMGSFDGAEVLAKNTEKTTSKELFNKAKPHYESALKQSGHNEKLTYTERKKPAAHTAQNSRKNRQRNVIWFNPPYSMNVQTNIGREFLNSGNTFRKITDTAAQTTYRPSSRNTTKKSSRQARHPHGKQL